MCLLPSLLVLILIAQSKQQPMSPSLQLINSEQGALWELTKIKELLAEHRFM